MVKDVKIRLMLIKSLRFFFIFVSFFFLNGCIQATAFLGPSLTVATTKNVIQAGFQYGANTTIKKETGKNSFEHLQEIVSNHYDDKN
tara:strand:- start:1221 stop:1481 length:261 start_codon:yes stop_codon:yes gene_type:complete